MKPTLKNKLKAALEKKSQTTNNLNKKPEQKQGKETKVVPAETATNGETKVKVQIRKTKVQIGKPIKKELSKLQLKMAKKLAGSKFRWINETLYTTQSDTAFSMFTKQPELFEIYHQGFQAQVDEWPVNPVDVFISQLETLEPETVVADMGCGEAAIAKRLHQKMKIHSFDLIAGNEFITACDIAHVPLKDESADIVVFSLSLMVL